MTKMQQLAVSVIGKTGHIKFWKRTGALTPRSIWGYNCYFKACSTQHIIVETLKNNKTITIPLYSIVSIKVTE